MGPRTRWSVRREWRNHRGRRGGWCGGGHVTVLPGAGDGLGICVNCSPRRPAQWNLTVKRLDERARPGCSAVCASFAMAADTSSPAAAGQCTRPAAAAPAVLTAEPIPATSAAAAARSAATIQIRHVSLPSTGVGRPGQPGFWSARAVPLPWWSAYANRIRESVPSRLARASGCVAWLTTGVAQVAARSVGLVQWSGVRRPGIARTPGPRWQPGLGEHHLGCQFSVETLRIISNRARSCGTGSLLLMVGDDDVAVEPTASSTSATKPVRSLPRSGGETEGRPAASSATTIARFVLGALGIGDLVGHVTVAAMFIDWLWTRHWLAASRMRFRAALSRPASSSARSRNGNGWTSCRPEPVLDRGGQPRDDPQVFVSVIPGAALPSRRRSGGSAQQDSRPGRNAVRCQRRRKFRPAVTSSHLR